MSYRIETKAKLRAIHAEHERLHARNAELEAALASALDAFDRLRALLTTEHSRAVLDTAISCAGLAQHETADALARRLGVNAKGGTS